jgi:adenylyltransferase/sulfurtransferase
MILKELGTEGQQKLLAAKVLVVGAGGLGCPVLQYLAAAGVGTLGIVDDDVVALSNLHRQVLYTLEDIGKRKAIQAAQRLQAMNEEVSLQVHVERLTTANAWDLFAPYDIVVDTTDNFPTRYLVNDACVLLQKPLVYGAVSRFEGQVAVFNLPTGGTARSVNYRDLFPNPPQEGEVANCAEAGVLGVLPAIIGSLQAAQAIKIITGIGKPLANRIQTYNLLSEDWADFEVQPATAPNPLQPPSREAFEGMNYAVQCGIRGFEQIEVPSFNQLLNRPDVLVLDVREVGEQPLVTEFPHRQAPLSTLQEATNIAADQSIVVFCQSGKRSIQAASLLANAFPQAKIYSLRGGIIHWKEQAKTQQHERTTT